MTVWITGRRLRSWRVVVGLSILLAGCSPEPASTAKEAPTPGQSPGLAAEEPAPGSAVESFVAAFADGYEVVRSTDPAGEGTEGRFEGFLSYRFTGKRPAAGVAPGTLLRFRLRVYRYGSEGSAVVALGRLAKEVDASMFFKSPLLALVRGAELFRLDGECLFGERAWAAVEAGLRDAVLGGEVAETGRELKVLCGGKVVRSPLVP